MSLKDYNAVSGQTAIDTNSDVGITIFGFADLN